MTPKDRDALIMALSCETGICMEDIEAVIFGLEVIGCFIAPVVATEEMLEGVTAADQAEPFSDKTMAGIWTAMQSANPYRKDPSQ